MLKKNDIYDLNVEGYTHDGAGIAKSDGVVIFIPGAAEGDRLRVKIIKVLANRAIGRIEEILEASPTRENNDCTAFPACGGCDFRHISYSAELCQKKNVVAAAFSKLGGVDKLPDDFEILPAPSLRAYRNKAIYPVGSDRGGKIVYGFYRKNSHNIVSCSEKAVCGIHPAFFDAAAKAVVSFMEKAGVKPYDEITGRGTVRAIYIRYGEVTGEVMVCIIAARPSLPRTQLLIELLQKAVPGLKTVVVNENPSRTNALLGRKNVVLYGDGVITDVLCGNRLTLSPLSFYQINRAQCERLYARVLSYARTLGSVSEMRALDLFCGVGSITLTLAPFFKEVAGIEIVPAAIENARQNAAQNGIKNVIFFCADALGAPEILREKHFSPDLVVVDPPRKGLSPQICDFLIKNEAKHLIYVSCEPSTLARDIKLLSAGGFMLSNLSAFDMFPRTANVECVALLSKVEKWL